MRRKLQDLVPGTVMERKTVMKLSFEVYLCKSGILKLIQRIVFNCIYFLEAGKY